jgi:hypothetical protein
MMRQVILFVVRQSGGTQPERFLAKNRTARETM